MSRKPDWLKVSLGSKRCFKDVSSVLAELGLNTVCQSAMCPNRGECWADGTATFMILGDVCTRACRFCAVKTDNKGCEVDATEANKLVEAAKRLKLDYIVLTSVDRDDLIDGGAGHFAGCIEKLKQNNYKVEVLIPDYLDERLQRIIEEEPDVLAHNIEVVEKLQHLRDNRASYKRSLEVLKTAKKSGLITKSSIMVGLGETMSEITDSIKDLLDVECDILVVGQYLQPTKKNLAVKRYYPPEEFDQIRDIAVDIGFKKVISSPLARTSYHAKESSKY